ncbi:MAG: SAM-dependent methyltransferase, partial [Planctomycetota bacterium]
VRGEPTAADRLLALLADAYGADWTADVRDKLLADVGAAGKTLDDWLRDSFFEQHLKLFQQRPFVWHIWDGLRDGFNCLVNYHQLAGPDGQGRRTLEKVAYEYLGDWITRQKAQQAAGEEGADARVAAAVHLQEQLAKIIEGEPPFDIFVRWKPLAEQPLGWEPDINDGVRLNIRPFMTAKPLGGPGKGKGKGKTAKNACILRTTPGIKWDKDRGSEPDRPKEHFPWFWTWDGETPDFTGAKEFDGNRHNNLHYSRKVKEAARAKATGSGTKPATAEARK